MPLIEITPEVEGVKPDTSLNSVDLPHPDGPSSDTNSPLSTRIEIFCNASAPVRNCLLTLSTAISGTTRNSACPAVTMLLLPQRADAARTGIPRCAQPAALTAASSSYLLSLAQR